MPGDDCDARSGGSSGRGRPLVLRACRTRAHCCFSAGVSTVTLSRPVVRFWRSGESSIHPAGGGGAAFGCFLVWLGGEGRSGAALLKPSMFRNQMVSEDMWSHRRMVFPSRASCWRASLIGETTFRAPSARSAFLVNFRIGDPLGIQLARFKHRALLDNLTPEHPKFRLARDPGAKPKNSDVLGHFSLHRRTWLLNCLSERRQQLMPEFYVYGCSGVPGTEMTGCDERDRGFRAT